MGGVSSSLLTTISANEKKWPSNIVESLTSASWEFECGNCEKETFTSISNIALIIYWWEIKKLWTFSKWQC